jgi:hypothetical protein
MRLFFAIAIGLCLILHVDPTTARPGGGHRFSSPSPAPRPSPRPSPRSYPSPSPRPSPVQSPSPSPDYGSTDYGSTDYGSTDYSGSGNYNTGYVPSSTGSSDTSSMLPWLFGVMLLIAAGVFVRVMIERRLRQGWSMGAMTQSYAPTIEPAQRPHMAKPVEAPAHPRRAFLALVRKYDPDFSFVLFEDFVYALFTAYHEARGGSTKHDLSPYVEEAAEAYLTAGRKDDVRNVIVGAMEITNARETESLVAVEVSFEANYEEEEAGRSQGYYSHETWVLQRSKGAKSRPPEKASIDECPNCGGPLENMDGNVCSYCKEALTPGQFDWAVTHIKAKRETRGPMLIGDVVEVGNELPTVIVGGAKERFAALDQRDSQFSWADFQKRVQLIFEALHEGWTARDWSKVRPYVSDQLFQSQLYWIEEYKRQKLNNRTDGARIVDMQMSNVETDRHFDAITVRVFATGKDYTLDEDGKIVSGSKTYDRAYTEYWTLIRGVGAKGEIHTSPSCPNCGADVDVNMAGACEHCDVKVTRGDFDWVLSRIEQDETYQR